MHHQQHVKWLRPISLPADLCPVGDEDGGGEVARHAGHDVDDGYTRCAGHLLQVSQEEKLNHHRQNQVDDAADTRHKRQQAMLRM